MNIIVYVCTSEIYSAEETDNEEESKSETQKKRERKEYQYAVIQTERNIVFATHKGAAQAHKDAVHRRCISIAFTATITANETERQYTELLAKENKIASELGYELCENEILKKRNKGFAANTKASESSDYNSSDDND